MEHTWNCNFTQSKHEVGCPHRVWSNEELKSALESFKEQLMLHLKSKPEEKIRTPFIEHAFERKQRVWIRELACWGYVLAIWLGDTGLKYFVRYFFNGESHEVYFLEEELSLEKISTNGK